MAEVSDSLKDWLNRQGMRGQTVGAVQPAVMKWANDLIDREEDGLADHSPSDGEEYRPNALPRLRIYRARPFLAVIDGGLAHD